MKKQAAAVRVRHTGMMLKIGRRIMCRLAPVVEECLKNIVQIIKRVPIANVEHKTDEEVFRNLKSTLRTIKA